MSANQAMSVAMVLEFILRSAAALVFWKKGWRPRFPAMGIYLALEAFSSLLLLIFFVGMQSQRPLWRPAYFYFYWYWAVYAVGAVLLYFICIEVLRSALAPYSGLLRFGVLIFRWLALPSLIVVWATGTPSQPVAQFVVIVSSYLQRAVSVLQLCLFAFLWLSLRALHLSKKHVAFGISIGFTLLSVGDLLSSLEIQPKHSNLTSTMQFLFEASQLLCQLVWIYYFAAPQPAPRRIVLSPTSRIYRWNEIASVLGNKGVQVAVSYPGENRIYSDLEDLAEATLPDRKNHGRTAISE